MALIYQTFSIGEADVKAYVTHNQAIADLWVYITKNRGIAYKTGVWYLCRSKVEAQKKVCFCDRGMSNLIVYFVNDQGLASWRTQHRFASFL
ncbi:DUF6150 family protein [Aliikangiella coralliicola]|uniref:7(1) septoil knot domain-containing protein n=1 Tax=Aliikangiella coralliicola TaxID=2592383 RepID=A0A545UCQ5_9GAMM|nr:DUF6150 family protein [Aliikangiella coralliicola]TQV87252.1 hypothetical protein FLL46_12420 [Aliikangiella coralliicola]